MNSHGDVIANRLHLNLTWASRPHKLPTIPGATFYFIGQSASFIIICKYGNIRIAFATYSEIALKIFVDYFEFIRWRFESQLVVAFLDPSTHFKRVIILNKY